MQKLNLAFSIET